MKKIVIVGCSGAGKSTLARELGKILQLPVFHLDAELWKPGWIMSSNEEEQIILRQLIEKETWIIDGNYGSTMPIRFEAADTIIFLDFPRWVCLRRVIKRWWKYRRKTRLDMGRDCPERLDWNFLKWVWNYRNTNRAKTLHAIKQYESGRKIIILHHQKEVQDILHMLND